MALPRRYRYGPIVTATEPQDARIRAPHIAGEREMLQGWIDFHRSTLLWKCQGLTGEQLVTVSAEPSDMTLLGLVRHMADVERWWFRRVAGQLPVEPRYWTDDHPDGDFELVDPAEADANFAIYREEVAAADEAVRDLDLDEVFEHPRRGTRMSLRWIYLHMIEEYARHNGHADLLRETIDGATGD